MSQATDQAPKQETAKATKKKSPKQSQFYKFVKLLFSSVSCRLNRYVFFNLPQMKNTIMLSNADYALVTIYAPVTLSMHLITFKDENQYNELVNYLKVPHDVPYVVRSNILTKAMSSNPIEDIQVVEDKDHNTRIIISGTNEVVVNDIVDEKDDVVDEKKPSGSSVDDDDIDENDDRRVKEDTVQEMFSSNDLLGTRIENMFAWNILMDEALVLNQYSSEYFKSRGTPYLALEHDPEKFSLYYSSRYRTVNIPHELCYKYSKTHKLAERACLVCIDGQDCASVKEFLKRVPGKMMTYLWSNNGMSIKHAVVYEDETLVVKTCRPFNELIPLVSREEQQ